MTNPGYYGSSAHARNEAEAAAAMSSHHREAKAKDQATELKRLKREVKRLETLVAEHHSVGAMDGFTVGQKCLVCNRKKKQVRRGH